MTVQINSLGGFGFLPVDRRVVQNGGTPRGLILSMVQFSRLSAAVLKDRLVSVLGDDVSIFRSQYVRRIMTSCATMRTSHFFVSMPTAELPMNGFDRNC